MLAHNSRYPNYLVKFLGFIGSGLLLQGLQWRMTIRLFRREHANLALSQSFIVCEANALILLA
jgi:hypothetical protein